MIRYNTILKRKTLYRKIRREMLWQNAQKVENVVAFLYSCHKIWADFMVLSENSLGTVYFVRQKLYNMYYTMKIIAVCVFNAQATSANGISQRCHFDRHYF